MECKYKPKTKFFITNKADLATEKVNKWLEENDDNIDVVSIQPFMSYTGAGNKLIYMIGCMVLYFEIPSRNEQVSL